MGSKCRWREEAAAKGYNTRDGEKEDLMLGKNIA